MTTPTTVLEDRPARVRVGYLVCGLVALGLSGVWALWASGLADGLSVSLLLPAVLVVAGVVGLLAMVLGGRRPARTVPAPEPVPTTGTSPEVSDDTLPHPTKES